MKTDLIFSWSCNNIHVAVCFQFLLQSFSYWFDKSEYINVWKPTTYCFTCFEWSYMLWKEIPFLNIRCIVKTQMNVWWLHAALLMYSQITSLSAMVCGHIFLLKLKHTTTANKTYNLDFQINSLSCTLIQNHLNISLEIHYFVSRIM